MSDVAKNWVTTYRLKITSGQKGRLNGHVTHLIGVMQGVAKDQAASLNRLTRQMGNVPVYVERVTCEWRDDFSQADGESGGDSCLVGVSGYVLGFEYTTDPLKAM